jgi:hypothetical protein
MSQYFDKDFWKFFLGFIAIVVLSLMIIIATKLYEKDQENNPAPVSNIAKP